MKNNFSKRVQMVIQFSREEALRLGHNYIGAEHLLLGIIRQGDGLAVEILSNLGVELDELKQSLEDAVRTSGGTMTLGNLPLTKRAEKILKSTYDEAKNFKSDVIDSEHLLLAIAEEVDSVAAEVLGTLGVDYDLIYSELERIQEGSEDVSLLRSKKDAKTPALDHFGRDLTKLAVEGDLDPVIGREKEIERVAQILSRRKKNNPVLIGEPGVGKTAIAEGLALRIIERKVPRVLFDKKIITLDLSSMVAGTKYRGQFEERMKAIMTELEKNSDMIIFIDELHTIVGAGAASGSLDASNMFKPALARGEIQCIGATTLDEYRKYIEKDGALDRRFQKIMVNPPTVEESILILQGLKSRYEEHHHVKYTDDALETAVKLSDRYITDKYLPDKAIDVMDETGSRVHLSNFNVPEEVINLETEIDTLKKIKDEVVKSQNFEKAAEIRDKERKLIDELEIQRNKWNEEQEGNIVLVTEDDMADVVSIMTGIPVHRVAESESARLTNIESELKKKIVGQDYVISHLSKSIRRARAGLKNPNRPIGSFIFLGPTGVGKTELAKVLANYLFEDDESFIRIDMSEYMEKFSVSRLMGAPPGYVGYEEGGDLTEKVRRRPYSVVLFDEVEKAHYDIFNILLQILEDGVLTDSFGRKVDFRNTIIILTSNIGGRMLRAKSLGFGGDTVKSRNEEIKKKVMDEAKQIFNPEFLNRIDEIEVFKELDRPDVLKIVDIMIDEIKKRLSDMHIELRVSRAVKSHLLEVGFNREMGARPMRRAIEKEVEDAMAERILSGDIADGSVVKIGVSKGKLTFTEVERKKITKDKIALSSKKDNKVKKDPVT
ncbi:MAG: ATP-dependent Clp protease ATP-binding subunit [Candidatus Marinimicrobia bacterium]|nr:ATP-dependent Clp protease ATP-binding subunit [Candidatus Neomarinimicrobiota bacterium]